MSRLPFRMCYGAKPLQRVVEDTIPEAHNAKSECGTRLSFVGDDRAGWKALPTSRQPRSFPPLRQRDRQRLSMGLGLWRSRTLLWKKGDPKRARARTSANSGFSGFRVLTASDPSPPSPVGSLNGERQKDYSDDQQPESITRRCASKCLARDR